MKFQQAFNTLIAVLLASLVAEWLDTRIADSASFDVDQVEMALTVSIGGALSGLIEFLRALALDAMPAARFPRIYKMLGGTLLALVLVGCASPQTPAQGYFAAKASYATAGDLVNAWCAQPATARDDCVKVDEAMDKAEAEIRALDAIASPTDSTYELATALLVRALEIANRYVPEVKAP